MEERRAYIEKFTEVELVEQVESSRSLLNEDYKNATVRIDKNMRKLLANIDYDFKDALQIEIERLMDVRNEFYTNWAAEQESLEHRTSVM